MTLFTHPIDAYLRKTKKYQIFLYLNALGFKKIHKQLFFFFIHRLKSEVKNRKKIVKKVLVFLLIFLFGLL